MFFDEMQYIDLVLDQCHLLFFFIFKNLYMGFRWGQSSGTNLGFQGSIQNRHLALILVSFMHNQVIKFQCADNLGKFGYILSDKNQDKYLLKLIICASTCLHFGHCVLVAVFRLLCFSRFSNHHEFHDPVHKHLQNFCNKKAVAKKSVQSPTSSELRPRFSWPVTKFHRKIFFDHFRKF